MINIPSKLKIYAQLARLDKPIGILLLLWPTLWALWLANQGPPSSNLLFICIAGVVLMRSAGCVMNDVADRHFDPYVARTRHRPLASGLVSVHEALMLAASLALLAFVLVLQCNELTIQLSLVGALLAVIYPFLKRITHLPQLGLGVAFAWGVPMAFAASQDHIPSTSGWIFSAAALWPVIYDTMYAMVDRDEDVVIGVKSTAILFGKSDILIIAILQFFLIGLLATIGIIFNLNYFYFLSLIVVINLFAYQLFLIKNRDKNRCFRAFLNNHWVGLTIFIGVLLGISV